ncbi:MAG TPA: hypothetical protein VD969_03980 [Symbiobacteriaceae bacterium]|nr:hypothetical protein [Symbiobacteriaceae bacterium]
MPDPLRHVRALAGAREAAGPGEAAAARYIVEAARAYTHQVWMEPFPSFRSSVLPYLLVFAVSLAGGLLLPFGTAPAAVVSTLAAAAFAGQSLGWTQLGWLFERGESRNVVAVVPSERAIRRRLVLVAHVDSPGAAPAAVEPAGAGVMILPVLAAAAAVTGNAAWAWLCVVPLLLIARGIMLLVCAHRKGRRPEGGEAGGPALALAAGEALAQVPLQHTEVWTVFAGAREPGMVGLQFFLQQYGRLLAEADFVVLESRQSGGPAYTLAEGVMPAKLSDDELAGHLQELAAQHPDWRLTGTELGGRETQGALVLDEGFRAVSLLVPANPRALHDLVRLLRALGELIDRDARQQAEAGM